MFSFALKPGTRIMLQLQANRDSDRVFWAFQIESGFLSSRVRERPTQVLSGQAFNAYPQAVLGRGPAPASAVIYRMRCPVPRKQSVPSYRLHKPSGQGVVTLRTAGGGRRDVYLGEHNSPASLREYARLIAEQATAPVACILHTTAQRLTCDQLILQFLAHAKTHYRAADGKPSREVIREYGNSLRYVHTLYGLTPAADFGPRALKTVRQQFVERGNSRTTINARIARVKIVFKWAASEELVPVTTYQGLRTVGGLEAGRTEARERGRVLPVDAALVEATVPHLGYLPAGLVRFQQFTGCRPGEACRLRRCDIDESGAVWLYKPTQHKTAHHGKERIIAIGPKGQALLREYMTEDVNAYVFGGTAPLLRRSYQAHVARACDKAGVERWAPNRLRHTFATDVRRSHGLEAVQVLLGHSKADVTQVYAERNLALAVAVAAQVG